ncbi:MAG: tRNA (guanosine(46)-N(7))-methyltransferase TrmB [Planctomycetota bacterium]
MPRTEPKTRFNPRMHEGGKLSFRRRLKDPRRTESPLLVFGGEDPPPLAALVPRSFSRIAVEIGPGKGAFLLAAAGRDPERFLLGIEAAASYASAAAARLHEEGCENALVLVDNGKLYLEDRVPEASLESVHVYYPDPWPKRRHAGRRFFTDGVPSVLARVLIDDGFLYCATDNAAYAGQICRVMGAAAEFARDEREERRAAEAGPGIAFSPTNFERKYAREGRLMRRYAWRRKRR